MKHKGHRTANLPVGFWICLFMCAHAYWSQERRTLDLVWAGERCSVNSPLKWHQNCNVPKHLASLLTHPLSCCSTKLGEAWFAKIAAWSRRGEKQLVLHGNKNTPGPVLRPALHRHENKALNVLCLDSHNTICQRVFSSVFSVTLYYVIFPVLIKLCIDFSSHKRHWYFLLGWRLSK